MPAMDAVELLAVLRAELAPVEHRLADHRYLAELEVGRVPLESLRVFAGEQRRLSPATEQLRTPGAPLPGPAGG